jgi:hypothetical protein
MRPLYGKCLGLVDICLSLTSPASVYAKADQGTSEDAHVGFRRFQGEWTPNGQAQCASRISRILLAESVITVPGPKTADAPLLNRNS